MTALLEVETEDLVAAAHAVQAEIADPLNDVLSALITQLADGDGMAGSDPGGRSWAADYDRGATEVLAAGQDVINGCYRLATMFVHTARNYEAADAASTPGVRHSVGQALRGVASDAEVVFGIGVPSAAGSAGGGPPGWGLIEGAVGYVWPNGDPGRLRRLGAAWRSSSDAFRNAAEFAVVAAERAGADRLPEAADMQAVCAAMSDHLVQVAHAQRGLGEACVQLADHIDALHAEVVGELKSLLEWTAAIEAGGALLSVVTFGSSEAAAQGLEAARVARTAAKVGAAIQKFIELARSAAAAVSSAMERARAVRARVRAVLNVRVVDAAVVGVGRLPMLQVGREAGAVGREAGAVGREAAAVGRLESEAIDGVRNFPDDVSARRALDGPLRRPSNKFFKKSTGKSRDFRIIERPDGMIQLQYFSPANNAGYGKLYVQVLDRDGSVVENYRDTVGPDGVINRKWQDDGSND